MVIENGLRLFLVQVRVNINGILRNAYGVTYPLKGTKVATLSGKKGKTLMLLLFLYRKTKKHETV